MAKIVDFKNKWVKRVAQGLSLATVAAVMQACYGIANDSIPDMSISGKVFNYDGEPIPDIDITVNGQYVSKSGVDGNFGFYSPIAKEYTIGFCGNDVYQGRDTVILRDYQQRIVFNFKLAEK